MPSGLSWLLAICVLQAGHSFYPPPECVPGASTAHACAPVSSSADQYGSWASLYTQPQPFSRSSGAWHCLHLCLCLHVLPFPRPVQVVIKIPQSHRDRAVSMPGSTTCCGLHIAPIQSPELVQLGAPMPSPLFYAIAASFLIPLHSGPPHQL